MLKKIHMAEKLAHLRFQALAMLINSNKCKWKGRSIDEFYGFPCLYMQNNRSKLQPIWLIEQARTLEWQACFTKCPNKSKSVLTFGQSCNPLICWDNTCKASIRSNLKMECLGNIGEVFMKKCWPNNGFSPQRKGKKEY